MSEAKIRNPIELHTFHIWREVGVSLLGLILGLGLLISLSFWGPWAEKWSKGIKITGGWESWFIVPLLIGLGLLFGNGRGLWSLFVLKITSYKSPPIQKIACPSCSHIAEVNIRKYSFLCQNCDEQVRWTPFGFDVNPDLAQYRTVLERGVACPKCHYQNPLNQRAAWFTCPECKSRVDLERVPIEATADETAVDLKPDRDDLETRVAAGSCPKCGTQVGPTDQNCPSCRINLLYAREHLDQLLR